MTGCKRRVLWLLAGLLALAGAACSAADDGPSIVLFYEEGCSSCSHVEEVIAEYVALHPGLRVERHEIDEPGALELLGRLSDRFGVAAIHVPVTFVGEVGIVGGERSQEMQLREAIELCVNAGCPSPLAVGGSPLLLIDFVTLGGFVVLFAALLLLQGI